VFSWVKCSWPHAEFGTRETEFESPHPHVLVARHNATMANLKREYIDGEGWKTVVDAGGGAQPITREILAGGSTTIANGVNGKVSWGSKTFGDDLLDLSDPKFPTVVTAGTYAVSVDASPDADMTVGGNFRVALELDAFGEGARMSSGPLAVPASYLVPSVSIALTYYLVAGAALTVTILNLDGVQDLPFTLNSVIQRLS
jgi:hypothetical protein